MLEHGAKRLSQSGVILDYLAAASGNFGWTNGDERREILRWILWDNHKLTSYIATLRYMVQFAKIGETPVTEFLRGRVKSALGILDLHLARQKFVAGEQADDRRSLDVRLPLLARRVRRELGRISAHRRLARADPGAAGLGASLRADARTSAARKTGLAALTALFVAACGAPTPPPEAPSQQPAAPAPQTATPKPEPARTPLDRYKRAVAEQILKANAASTFEGVPPHLLRAVIVLQLTVDDKGKVTAVKLLRSPNAALTTVATNSVRAAGALPAPPRELLRGGRLEFAETWLFRDDGKFQVRSLAEAQTAVVD